MFPILLISKIRSFVIFDLIFLFRILARANSENFKNLKLLDLYETSLGSEGGRVLAESKNLSNLQTLILIHNDINEETQELIKNSKNLPNLTKVVFLPPKKAED